MTQPIILTQGGELSPTMIIIILVVLGIVAYFIKGWFDDYMDAKGAGELAGNPAMTETGAIDVVKDVPPSAVASAKDSLGKIDVKAIGKMIYDAHSTLLDDDEDAIYSAFNMLKNKVQLAFLSTYFKKLYKIDLFTYLQSFLNYTELANVNAIVSKYKPY